MSTLVIDKKIVKKLITQEYGSLESALFDGAKTGNIPLIETVLALTEKTGTPSQAFSAQGSTRNPILNIRDKNGNDLLCIAAYNGQAKVIDYLVSKGADVNAAHPERKSTALMAAVEHPKCIEALLKHGANPNQAASQGFTPLMEAACINNKKSVQILLAYKANPNARTADGLTALHFATDNSYGINSAICLIQAGADVNAVCEGKGYFKTSLTNAIAHGSVNMVKLLLKNGADPTITHTNGIASALRTAQNYKTSRPELLPIIEKAIAAWPKASGGASDAPAQPLAKAPQRPAARVHRFAV